VTRFIKIGKRATKYAALHLTSARCGRDEKKEKKRKRREGKKERNKEKREKEERGREEKKTVHFMYYILYSEFDRPQLYIIFN
jgi:hypothetical protein